MLFDLFASPALRANLIALDTSVKNTKGSFLFSYFLAALLALCTAMTTLCMESSMRHIDSKIEDISRRITILMAECDLM